DRGRAAQNGAVGADDVEVREERAVRLDESRPPDLARGARAREAVRLTGLRDRARDPLRVEGYGLATDRRDQVLHDDGHAARAPSGTVAHEQDVGAGGVELAVELVGEVVGADGGAVGPEAFGDGVERAAGGDHADAHARLSGAGEREALDRAGLRDARVR